MSALSSQWNPRGSMRSSLQPVFAHKRIMLPVFGGISGRYKITLNMTILMPAKNDFDNGFICWAKHLVSLEPNMPYF